MEPPSSPSSTITAPPDCHETAQMLAKLSAEAMICHFALLHYDSVSKSMVEWCWPSDNDGKKVPLSNFDEYREEHKFQYPCCLCASSSGEKYTEVAVYSWREKATNKTYWYARCATDECGYRVEIEAYYHQSSVGTFNYPLREHEKLCPIELEWTWREQSELMAKLNSVIIRDGISEAEFGVLFRRCRRCRRVGVRSTMKRHIQNCSGGVQKRRAKPKRFVIDGEAK
ncbi:hypothetical protein P692DRAFT_20755022 [Suillus brevipes Sb2]|nr:hypothetical protein P692DRAFT_20755022 [Suillus brevipes Sb2]